VTAKQNFFIIGAPKCGTTSLFYYLIQHPNVYELGMKEPHFLCEDFPGIRRLTRQEDYDRLFQHVGPEHKAVGEASMTYMYSDVALRRIVEINPEARIIYMLRTPLEMVPSWHSQMVKTLREDVADFSQAWSLQEQRAAGRSLPLQCPEPFFLQYRELGLLGKHLQRLRSYFPAENIKLVFNEDLRDRTAETYAEILEFLRLPPFEEVDFAVLNVNKTIRSRRAARLINRLLEMRFVGKLAAFKKRLPLGKVSIRQKIRQLNQVPVSRGSFAPEFRKELAEAYQQDVKLLAELSGRNLDHWLAG
jgi:hypothetical protein